MKIRVEGFVARWVAMSMLAPILFCLSGCEEDSPPSHGTLLPGRYRITVYYTPVESYHGGAMQAIQGCASADCASGSEALGTYPSSFINEVRMQGVGRITSGAHAGKYLNGSLGGGFRLTTFPPDAYGSSLRPFVTAAADTGVLPRGTRFKLVEPLVEGGGAAVAPAVAERLRSATWDVQDVFEAGYGGGLHIDIYVGEQNSPDFASTSPYYLMLENTAIEVF